MIYTRKLTCPYCFEKFEPGGLKFRCINPNPAVCEPEADIALQQYKGIAVPPRLPKVISASNGHAKRLPERAACDCGTVTSKAVCPACHNTLPHQFGMAQNVVVALIGAKNVGKSHYIAVLIHELKNRIGANFNASLMALDDQTIRRYNNDFKRHLYDSHEVIPVTMSARTRVDVRYPLAYRMTMEQQRLAWWKVQRAVDLVFFDTAGEDLMHLDTMSTETRYVANADGLIFLLDPLQIPAVRQSLPPDIPLPPQNNDQEQIIERAAKLVQQLRGLRPGQRIDIPVAIAFSKMDALRSIVDPLLLRASNHKGYLDISDMEIINDLFTTYVEMWLGNHLLTFLRQHFKRFSFFGLSALGSPPDPFGKLPKGVSPYRIEDPLLWVLYQKSVIQAKRVVGG